MALPAALGARRTRVAQARELQFEQGIRAGSLVASEVLDMTGVASLRAPWK